MSGWMNGTSAWWTITKHFHADCPRRSTHSRSLSRQFRVPTVVQKVFRCELRWSRLRPVRSALWNSARFRRGSEWIGCGRSRSEATNAAAGAEGCAKRYNDFCQDFLGWNGQWYLEMTHFTPLIVYVYISFAYVKSSRFLITHCLFFCFDRFACCSHIGMFLFIAWFTLNNNRWRLLRSSFLLL